MHFKGQIWDANDVYYITTSPVRWASSMMVRIRI